jgi:hypothetical protein
MSKMSPQEMAKTLAQGLLSFPVTHFDQNFRFQEGPYREHCAWLLSFKRLTGLFAAARAMTTAYQTLHEEGSLRDHLDLVVTFDDFNRVVDLDRHYGLESRYVGEESDTST